MQHERTGWKDQQSYISQVKSLLEKRFDHPPMACVRTFGCQQNEADSEKIRGMLSQMGYGLTEETALADLILFNTCAVRENKIHTLSSDCAAVWFSRSISPNALKKAILM